MQRRLFAILAATIGIIGPAQATHFSTISQYFDAHYAEHGSNNSGVEQYNGPLRIYDVTVDWNTGASAAIEMPHDPSDSGTVYQQYYEGGAYWIMYSSDTFDPIAGDGISLSGYTDCTEFSCYVSVGGGGTTNLDPYYFKGDGYITIDANGGISPSWGFNDGEPYYSWEGLSADGYVTYTLGPVPEPASWVTMLAGFGLIGCAGRLRTARRGALAAD